jgi:hypothetical protein
MKRLLFGLALLATPAMACPPEVNGGGFSSFGGGYGGGGFSSFGAGYGAGGCVGGACAAPVAAFSAPAYGYGAMVAPVVQQQVFAAPSYSVGFAAPAVYGGFSSSYGVAAPVVGVGYGGFGNRFGGGFGGRFGGGVYGGGGFVGGGFGGPVVAVPFRAPGPIRGAIQGFRGGLRNRLNGF